ncbi:hypothetical protein SAMN05877753_11033 [Bacillus oleivorans]|uniref:Uncharacterized protein n=1 Tax=Bacillus oleivorans TaxID=1448271 RepID=A0A285D4I0_9BACI|nr:hypothetical protein [Bacillus oleivorans]SNX74712.1 hypothetical protein SAMN05877753_11033 [Bacillus oleivorans]
MTTPDQIQDQVNRIFKETCGSWQNCNQSNVLSFLAQCEEQGLDPQYCFSWLSQNKELISDWSHFSQVAQEWVNEHTSTGSPETVYFQDQ